MSHIAKIDKEVNEYIEKLQRIENAHPNHKDEYVEGLKDELKEETKERVIELAEKQESKINSEIEQKNQQLQNVYDVDHNERTYKATIAKQEIDYIDNVKELEQVVQSIDDPIKHQEILRIAKMKFKNDALAIETIKDLEFDTLPRKVADIKREIARKKSLLMDINDIKHSSKKAIDEVKTNLNRGKKPTSVHLEDEGGITGYYGQPRNIAAIMKQDL